MMLERDLAELLEGTTDAAFAVDLHGEVRIWNKAAEKLFGYPASLAIGKPCVVLVGGRIAIEKEVCSESCDILDCVRTGREMSNFDMEINTRGRERVWVNVSLLVAVNEGTDRRLAIHFMRDVRERKRAEHLTSKMLMIANELVNGVVESDTLPPIPPLTAQEKNILLLLASGKTTKEITAELLISPRTLRNHIYHVNQKLHSRSRIEAVMQASKRGLI